MVQIGYRILINTTGNHWKYWSHNNNPEGGLVDIHWGRIGTDGQRAVYAYHTALSRANDKLASGYVEYASNSNHYAPTNQQVIAVTYQGGRTEIGENSGTPQPRGYQRTRRQPQQRQTQQRQTQQRRQGIELPELNRRHNIPDVEEYKTNQNGYIRNYRRGYDRNNLFNDYIDRLKIIPIVRIVEARNSLIKNLAREYFNRIPNNSQYNKPPELNDLREPARPTYAAIYTTDDDDGLVNECIGIYGVHRRQSYCDFLALKSNIPNRRSVLKLVLSKIASAPRDARQITFKLKSAAMRNEIKEVADYFVSQTGNEIVYNIEDLRTGIALPQSKPKTWIGE